MPVRQLRQHQPKLSSSIHRAQIASSMSLETPEAIRQAIVNPIKANLTPNVVLSLQRTYGNRFVQRLINRTPSGISRKVKVSVVNSPNAVVQRDHKDNVDDFIGWMTGHATYKEFAYPEAGNCAPSTKAIAALLKAEGIAFQVRGILLFHRPEERMTNMNYNHYVVVATIAGQRIVIDPTQGQFQGGGAMIAREGEWVNKFKSLQARMLRSQSATDMIWKNPPMKYKDGNTWDDANNYAKDYKVIFNDAEGTVLNNAI